MTSKWPEVPATEKEDLYAWLHDQGIETKRLSREFSDGVRLAGLLKKFYPKIVQLHNYVKCNSLKAKMGNWMMLNRRVLLKLGIPQSIRMLRELASGTPGAMDFLLSQVMLIAEVGRNQDGDDALNASSNVRYVTVNRSKNGKTVPRHLKMINYKIYAKALDETKEQETRLQIAKQKIFHLENLIRMYDERIGELRNHVMNAEKHVRLRLMMKRNAVKANSKTNRSIGPKTSKEQTRKARTVRRSKPKKVSINTKATEVQAA